MPGGRPSTSARPDMTDPTLDRGTVAAPWHPGAVAGDPHASGAVLVSLSGATLFATMSVGATIVLGRVTDELIVPAFETEGDRSGDPRRGARHHDRRAAAGHRCVGRRFFGGVTVVPDGGDVAHPHRRHVPGRAALVPPDPPDR